MSNETGQDSFDAEIDAYIDLVQTAYAKAAEQGVVLQTAVSAFLAAPSEASRMLSSERSEAELLLVSGAPRTSALGHR